MVPCCLMRWREWSRVLTWGGEEGTTSSGPFRMALVSQSSHPMRTSACSTIVVIKIEQMHWRIWSEHSKSLLSNCCSSYPGIWWCIGIFITHSHSNIPCWWKISSLWFRKKQEFRFVGWWKKMQLLDNFLTNAGSPNSVTSQNLSWPQAPTPGYEMPGRCYSIVACSVWRLPAELRQEDLWN